MKACKKLGVEYQIIHKDKIAVRIKIREKYYYFIHHHKPFNTKDVAWICRDKDLSYTILGGKLNVPRWKSYLTPYAEEPHRHLVRFHSIESISEDMEREFRYPFIVKQNRGTMGHNVFLCNERTDVVKALEAIYHGNGNRDYLAIAQEKIDIVREYRVVVYKRNVIFSYLKDNSAAKFNGNWSPLHWEGAKAELVEGKELNAQFEEFLKPIYEEIDLIFGGIDIAVDRAGKMWLIELNSSPGLGHFIKDCGDKEVVRMYEIMLLDLQNR